MTPARSPIARTQGHTADGDWAAWTRPPDRRVQPGVIRYVGFAANSAAGSARQELPGTTIPVIITFDTPYRVGPVDDTSATSYRTFVAGLSDQPTIVGSGRRERCIQIDFTPLGARRFLGIPMHLLARQTFELRDLLGASVTELVEQLAETESWNARFALIDAFLLARHRATETPSDEVRWAWEQLARTHGAVRIGTLTRQLGWTRRRLGDAFRTEIGLTPKPVARLLRFEETRRRLDAGDPAIEVATAVGFADQAHMVRECVDLTGATPRQLANAAASFEEQIFNPTDR